MDNLDVIEKILIEAGNLLEKRFNSIFAYKNKEKFDLVTDVDIEVEKFVIKKLEENFSNASFYSEEIGEINNHSEQKWIIDPLDGTANFIFGVPYFNISLALEYNDEIIEGYVYNPISKELYYSSKNLQKSFLNRRQIFVSDKGTIPESLVVFGYSSIYKNIEKYYKKWHELFDHCKKGMGLLSPALTICNVARGRIDCFIDFGSSMEGHAAGALILKNAGGIVYNYDLTEWDYKTKGIIAINKNLQGEIERINRL